VPNREPKDAVLAALEDLEVVLGETARRNQIALRRAAAIRRLRERGLPYREIVPMEERPLVVELLASTLFDLSSAGSNFRKVEARALYSEGLTMAEIAELFGVTRQRIAALIRRTNDEDGKIRMSHRRQGLGLVTGLLCGAFGDFPLSNFAL
jgi:hypothetical protein